MVKIIEMSREDWSKKIDQSEALKIRKERPTKNCYVLVGSMYEYLADGGAVIVTIVKEANRRYRIVMPDGEDIGPIKTMCDAKIEAEKQVWDYYTRKAKKHEKNNGL